MNSATPLGRSENGGRLRTGVPGLDEVLCGGLPERRLYLVQGDPGSGKTTLAMRFLLEGVQNGERALYVTLSETREEIDGIARSHGWSLEGLSVSEVSSDATADELETTLYQPAEVELGGRMRALLDEIDRLKPTRLVLDSCSELRLLSGNALRYRRQILALKSRLVHLGCTILLPDSPHPDQPDMVLQSVVHGVIAMEQLSPLYGAERRRLRVVKLRGIKYRGGFHDFVIRTGGLEVFPRLVSSEHRREFADEFVSSGVPALDQLLGGGPHRGTSLLLLGPAGAGKSALAAQYALAAAQRGERAAVFAFEESVAIFLARGRSLGMDLRDHLEAGRLSLRQVDPAELSPGEFSQDVQRAVEVGGARVVVIDSLNGYLNAMPQENFLALQLHELLACLGQQGVLTVLTVAQHGLVSAFGVAPVDLSYLADNVLLLRYFEEGGAVKKALSVLKKRAGPHENTVRELAMGSRGVQVGPIIERIEGVLGGYPRYSGRASSRERAP